MTDNGPQQARFVGGMRGKKSMSTEEAFEFLFLLAILQSTVK